MEERLNRRQSCLRHEAAIHELSPPVELVGYFHSPLRDGEKQKTSSFGPRCFTRRVYREKGQKAITTKDTKVQEGVFLGFPREPSCPSWLTLFGAYQ